MASAVSNPVEIADRPAAPACEPLPQIPERFVVFDLETTGLDPHEDEIIEIGAIRVDQRSGGEEQFRVLVRPDKALSRYITGLTGITQAMVDEEGVRIEDALLQFRDFISELPLVSYAAGFDMGFLERAMRACDPPLELRNSICCAMQMARRAWPFLPSFRLAEVAGNAASFKQAAHRALGDCERALLVYRAAVQEVRKLAD
jgi:DNA polymerase III subunit epsilon